jgi:hypothetical protein
METFERCVDWFGSCVLIGGFLGAVLWAVCDWNETRWRLAKWR